jgi:hypothetical protein
MAAKVGSSALQDGYQLYDHAFFFTTDQPWCVVQQGMNDGSRIVRRYVHSRNQAVGGRRRQ